MNREPVWRRQYSLSIMTLSIARPLVNAVLLPLHVIALQLLASDPAIMGESKSGNLMLASGWFGVVLILACIGALAISWITSS